LLIGRVALPSERLKIEAFGMNDDDLHGMFNA
jgi:hypothetical protein